MLDVKICGSILGMDKDEWDRVKGRDLFLSYEYLRHVEMTMQEGYLYRYLMISRDGIPTVCAAVFVTDIKLDTLLDDGRLKRFVTGTRKLVPSGFIIRTLVVGSPPSVGNFGIGIRDGIRAEEEIDLLTEKLDLIMKKENAGMILYKEIPEDFRNEYSGVLKKAGLHIGYDMPNNFLDIIWESDEEYLGAMRGKSRQAIRNSAKKLKAENVSTACLRDTKSRIGKREYDMYHTVLMKSGNIFEILTHEYFSHIEDLEEMDPCLIAVMLGGNVIGYFLCCDSAEDEVSAMFAGIDYSKNREYDVYFNLFHQVILYAMSRGKKRVCFGQNTYEVKQRMGCRTEELYIGFRHRNKPLDSILSMLSPVLLPKTEIKKRRVFKEEV